MKENDTQPPPIPPPPPPAQPLPSQQQPAAMGDDVGMRLLLPVGRSGWAIAAGYLGLFALVIIPAPLALIVSIVAFVDIRRSRNDPSPKHGMGRAVFGFLTGLIGTVLLVVMLIAANSDK